MIKDGKMIIDGQPGSVYEEIVVAFCDAGFPPSVEFRGIKINLDVLVGVLLLNKVKEVIYHAKKEESGQNDATTGKVRC
jgi:hypothetical protein